MIKLIAQQEFVIINTTDMRRICLQWCENDKNQRQPAVNMKEKYLLELPHLDMSFLKTEFQL